MLLNIKPLHDNFQVPKKQTLGAGGFDLYMPEAGSVKVKDDGATIGLGFAMQVPDGCVALLLPRSGVGVRYGLGLMNTCGVIDSDYRGEVKVKLSLASMSQGDQRELSWEAGDRLIQMLIVPVYSPYVSVVTSLPESARDCGGFGHTGA